MIKQGYPLSSREQQICDLMAAGVQTGDIARTLDISVKTVSTYYGNLRIKLGYKNVHEMRLALVHQQRSKA